MPPYAKVKDAPGLVRGENNAILNVNNTSLESYRKKRDHNARLEQAITDINTIKSEFTEIKSLLGKIIGELKSDGTTR